MFFNSNRIRMELSNSEYRIIEFDINPTLIEQEFNDGLLVKETKYSLRNELIEINYYEYNKDVTIISILDKENNLIKKLYCNQNENIVNINIDNKLEGNNNQTKYIFNNHANYYYKEDDFYDIKFEQNYNVIYRNLYIGYEENGKIINYKSNEIVLNRLNKSFAFINYDIDGSIFLKSIYFVGNCKISLYEEGSLMPENSTIYNYSTDGKLLNIEKREPDVFHEDKYSIEKIIDETVIDDIKEDKKKLEMISDRSKKNNFFTRILYKIKNFL